METTTARRPPGYSPRYPSVKYEKPLKAIIAFQQRCRILIIAAIHKRDHRVRSFCTSLNRRAWVPKGHGPDRYHQPSTYSNSFCCNGHKICHRSVTTNVKLDFRSTIWTVATERLGCLAAPVLLPFMADLFKKKQTEREGRQPR